MLSARSSNAQATPALTHQLRQEKRQFDDLVNAIEAGLLSDEQVLSRIKSLEKALRCLRYARPDTFGFAA